MSEIATALPPDDGLVPGWLQRLAAVGWRLLAAVALVVVVIGILTVLSTVTASVLVAAIVAATFAPFVLALRNRGWSRIKAAAAVFLGAAAVIIATLAIIALAFLPYVKDVVTDFHAGIEAVKTLLTDYSVPPEVADTIKNAASGVEAWLSSSAAEIAGTLGIVFTIGLLTTPDMLRELLAVLNDRVGGPRSTCSRPHGGPRSGASSSPPRAVRSTARGATATSRSTKRRSPYPDAPYRDPGIQYTAEGYLSLYERLYGLSTAALRLGNVYGPRQDPLGEAGVVAIFCGALLEGRTPKVFGDADLQLVGIAELDRREALAPVLHAQHREVGAAILEHDLGVELALVVERDFHLVRAFDHVVVGDDQAVGSTITPEPSERCTCSRGNPAATEEAEERVFHEVAVVDFLGGIDVDHGRRHALDDRGVGELAAARPRTAPRAALARIG